MIRPLFHPRQVPAPASGIRVLFADDHQVIRQGLVE